MLTDISSSHPPSSPVSSPSSCASSKQAIVNALVNATSILLTTLWYEFNPKSSEESTKSLNVFIVTILRRSKLSNHTLQVALLYLLKLSAVIKNGVKSRVRNRRLSLRDNVLLCKKRTFLACLILAAKFSQDKNYSMKSWSVISGLPAKDLVANETVVLKALDYNLFINVELFTKWSNIVSYFVLISSRALKSATKTQAKFTKVSSQWTILAENLESGCNFSTSTDYFKILLNHHGTHNFIRPLLVQSC